MGRKEWREGAKHTLVGHSCDKYNSKPGEHLVILKETKQNEKSVGTLLFFNPGDNEAAKLVADIVTGDTLLAGIERDRTLSESVAKARRFDAVSVNSANSLSTGWRDLVQDAAAADVLAIPAETVLYSLSVPVFVDSIFTCTASVDATVTESTGVDEYALSYEYEGEEHVIKMRGDKIRAHLEQQPENPAETTEAYPTTCDTLAVEFPLAIGVISKLPVSSTLDANEICMRESFSVYQKSGLWRAIDSECPQLTDDYDRDKSLVTFALRVMEHKMRSNRGLGACCRARRALSSSARAASSSTRSPRCATSSRSTRRVPARRSSATRSPTCRSRTRRCST